MISAPIVTFALFGLKANDLVCYARKQMAVAFFASWCIKMVEQESDYRGVNFKRALIDEVEAFIQKTGTYTSVAAFASEAVRMRLETLKALYEKKLEA